jgi:RNA polymerase sigma-70 factor (ECF subfamily)
MDNSRIDDRALVSGIKKNNSEAFGQLYNRYKRIIYYFSLKYLGNPEEAEELVQNVFISLWQHRKLLDEKKPVKSYIYRSVVNGIYNILKKKAIRRKYILEELKKPEGSANPYEEIFYRDLDEKISSVISSLPESQQKIFNMSRSGGLSTEEIAQKLQISTRTVENQIYRVTKILKIKFRSESRSSDLPVSD